MSGTEFLLGFGGLVSTVFAFLFGRMFSQSEAVLSEKRRVYEEFLVACPMPNTAYEEFDPDRLNSFKSEYAKLMLYAEPAVVLCISRYMNLLNEADEILGPDSEALHPAFKAAAKAHNDIILEMRRDALGWSMFGYRGKTRLPEDALEQAKKNTL